MNREQPTNRVDTRCSPLIYTAIGAIGKKKRYSREMLLSKDGLHFRDQRIDISHRFNFGYYWFYINRLVVWVDQGSSCKSNSTDGVYIK